jgi:HSP20 family molecular chaperone IbpA
MASQSAATKSKDLSQLTVQKGHQHLEDRANQAITRRAYSLFLASGSVDGQDLAHWLQAESEILTRVPDIRESSSWFTVNIPLQGFTAEQIEVGVGENRAIIAADKTSSSDKAPDDRQSIHESVFLVANWPSAVEPSTASAYIKDQNLTLTVKRANQSQRTE